MEIDTVSIEYGDKDKRMRNLYEILEVSKNASNSEIRESYQRLVQTYAGKVSLLSIDMAYDILSRPNKRAEYDEEVSAPRYSPDYMSESSLSGFSSSSEESIDTNYAYSIKSTKLLNNISPDCADDTRVKSISLDMFIHAVEIACENYRQYHESFRQSSKHDRGHPQGRLSFFRHRAWLQTADNLKTLMNGMDTLDNAVKSIIAYLSNETRDYHTHSLVSYVLDEMRILLEKLGRPGLHDDSVGHYTERDWIWVTEVNVIDVYPINSLRC